MHLGSRMWDTPGVKYSHGGTPVVPVSHQNLLLHQAAAIILERTRANGGGTFALASDGRLTELKPTAGYAVGLKGGWVGEPTYDALLEALYALERRDRLPGTFGTWLSEGRLYLDPVAIMYKDVDAAIMTGMLNGQDAIYSFGAERDIRLKCADAGCDAPMYILVGAHAHTEDGKDVTGR